MAIPALLLLAVLALLLPTAAAGFQRAPNLGAGFRPGSSSGNEFCRRSSLRQQQRLHPIHHRTLASNDAAHHEASRHRLRESISGHNHAGKSEVPYRKNTLTRSAATTFIRTIHQIITKILSNLRRHSRNAVLKLSPLALSLALMFSHPMRSVASSNSATAASTSSQSSSSSKESPSYYLQNNPRHKSSGKTNDVISIQTQKSQPSTSRHGSNKNSNSNSDSDYRLVKQRTNPKRTAKKKRTARQLSILIAAASLAASSYRASLKKTKRVIRTASPFGRIRNASPLGNGVSVVRVCMALGFDDVDMNDKDAEEGSFGGIMTLLNRIKMEEEEFITKMTMLAQLRDQKQLLGSNVKEVKQKILGDYVSNVASVLTPYHKIMKYGYIDSMRVPFAHEAAKAFRMAAKEERKTYDSQTKQQQSTTTQTTTQKQQQQQQSPKTKFVLATILLAIKGDRTSKIPLPFGIIRQRDMARILSRIAEDVKVEDCLVGSDILLLPNTSSISGDLKRWPGLTEEDIAKSFPELVQLT